MKEQINIFFTALMFYTRIPCPKGIHYASENLHKTARYFPLIGWIVGFISFIIFYGFSFLFPDNIAVLFSIIGGILTTGAFHEDGLADVSDGFGGGWTKEKILTIMKDSQVGTYGVISLILAVLLKYSGLIYLTAHRDDIYQIILFYVTYHSLARLTAIHLVFTESYAREDSTSKSKSIIQKTGLTEILLAYSFGLSPLLLLSYLYSGYYMLIIAPLLILYFGSKKYFNKWIGGYTGDCLGAVEQFAEIIILLSFVALWTYTSSGILR